jgi:type II secretory pathway pseudopilin PulG
LLVVIAIIGILVALLLPAIQSARASARRTQCQNNLKQIGIALHSYHIANKQFPEGMRFDANAKFPHLSPGASRSDKYRPNWIIMILPYMEEQAVYDAFDFDQYISHQNNREVRGTRIPTLLCPEDNGVDVPFGGLSPTEGDNWGRANYACNGDNEGSDLWPITKDPQKIGVLRLNKKTKISQIIDGTSHTILAAEIRIGLSDIDRRGVWAMGTAGASNLVWHGFGGDCNGPNPSNELSDDILGCGGLMATLGPQLLTQERMTCWTSCDSHQAAPRSRHAPGGVHVVMCDGSVHWIDDGINTNGPWGACCSVWDRLVAARDGLPVELEW